MQTRIEKDSLGEFEVPVDAYYGVQTCRAVHNFQISGLGPWPEFVDAVVHIKKAAARVHGELGILTDDQTRTIVQAADEILAGYRGKDFEIHFPKRFTRFMKLLALLPARIYLPLVRRFAGG